MSEALEAVWVFLNSPPGIALMATAVVSFLNWLFAKKPGWKKYEGTAYAAVKAAEKAIPDGTPNKSAAKLDAALKYMLNVYEAREGKKATPAVEADFVEGIQVTHAKMEAGNN